MENVILFAPALRDDSNDYIWMNELRKAFSSMGYRVIRIDLSQPNANDLIVEALSGYCRFAIGMQNTGIGMMYGDGKSIYDAFNIPYVNILTDTPYNPNSEVLFNIKIDNQIVLCMDKSYVQYLSAWGKFFPKVGVLLLAGTRDCDNVNVHNAGPLLTARKKDINILFIGANYSYPERRWWHGNMPPPIVEIMDDVVDYVLSKDYVSIVEAFEYICKIRNFELNNERRIQLYYPVLQSIYLYVFPYRRRKLVEIIAQSGIHMHVLGKNWEQEKYAKWLTLHGQVSYRDSLNIMGKSKILLNDNGDFCYGAHERIFAGMLNGSLIVTGKSYYCETNFVERDEYATYSWQKLDHLPHKLVDLLSDHENMDRMMRLAFEKAQKDHTWLARAKEIVSMVDQFFPSGN